MTELVKAQLAALDRNDAVTTTVEVQFNPTKMSLQMSNSTDGGQSSGRQTQQYNGSASTTLSLDLEFDSADLGVDDPHADVRTRTAEIAQFLVPEGEGSKQAPPRLRFRWGTFELIGTMSSVSEELSLFSREGVPLRAKVGVQIKGQDKRFNALERGAGANNDNKPPAAGGGGSGPGSVGGGFIDRVAAALSGETAADFLARNGLAPEAWRALGSALDALNDGIELQAGASIGFDSSLTIGAGIDVRAGLHVGLDISTEASLGLSVAVGATASTGGAGRDAALQQGRALAAAGGVTAATETAKTTAATMAADGARASFGAPTASGAGVTAPSTGGPVGTSATAATTPPGSRAPLAAGAAAAPARPAPPPPQADRRRVTFGHGVPLRDRVHVPGAEQDGYVVLGRLAAILPAADGSAPWQRLTASTVDGGGSGHRGGRMGCGCQRCGGRR